MFFKFFIIPYFIKFFGKAVRVFGIIIHNSL